MSEKNNTSPPRWIRVISNPEFQVLFLLLVAIFELILISNTEPVEMHGPIGDFFNGICGPFLQGSILILVFRSYYLQQTELRDTKDALRDQAIKMNEQTQQLILQSRDNTLQYTIDKWLSFSQNHNEMYMGREYPYAKVTYVLNDFESVYGDGVHNEIQWSVNEAWSGRESSKLEADYYMSYFDDVIHSVDRIDDMTYRRVLMQNFTPAEYKLVMLYCCGFKNRVATSVGNSLGLTRFLSESKVEALGSAYTDLYKKMFVPMFVGE